MNNYSPWELLEKEARQILPLFSAYIYTRQLRDRPRLMADHLCYVCGTTEQYQLLFNDLSQRATLVSEEIISGKRVVYFRLHGRIESCIGDILYIELAEPNACDNKKSAFTHIEVYPADQKHIYSIVDVLTHNQDTFTFTGGVSSPQYDIVIDQSSGFTLRIRERPFIEKINTAREST